MAARLLSHAKRTSVSAVCTTTPALRCYSTTSTTRAAPPLFSRVCTGTSSPPEKVRCVCEDTSSNGKSLVECLQCGFWSHIQCARLTQRTAKRSQFACHQCRTATSKGKKGTNLSKGLIVRFPRRESTPAQATSSACTSSSSSPHSPSLEPPQFLN